MSCYILYWTQCAGGLINTTNYTFTIILCTQLSLAYPCLPRPAQEGRHLSWFWYSSAWEVGRYQSVYKSSIEQIFGRSPHLSYIFGAYEKKDFSWNVIELVAIDDWLKNQRNAFHGEKESKWTSLSDSKWYQQDLVVQARSGSAVRIVNMMRLENISHFTHHVAGDCILGVEIHQFDVLLTRWTIQSCARHIPDWGRPIIWSYQYKTNGGETNKEPQPECR